MRRHRVVFLVFVAALACSLAGLLASNGNAVVRAATPLADDPATPATADAGKPGDYGVSTVNPAPRSATASRDTIYILGGPDRGDGKFQQDNNRYLPDDEGWVPLGRWDDGTGPYWHTSTFNAELLDPGTPDNYAIWCGKYYEPCENEPENPGYTNNLDAKLMWSGAVPDTNVSTLVEVTARLNYDTEPWYDFLYLEVWQGGNWTELESWTDNNKVGGVFEPVDVAQSVTVDPADYAGEAGDAVQLRWRFSSDGGWSDDDCSFQSDGAAQIDNIEVSFDQGGGPQIMTFDDFEDGNPVSWTFDDPLCSLAQVWAQLPDVGICGTNVTPQLAFIDDGSACFSDGSWGTDWTYGPDGMVVYCEPFQNHTDEFWSPALDLPADIQHYDGARLEFDVYVHGKSIAGPALIWHLRTSNDGGTFWSNWQNLSFAYELHGPEYRRFSFDTSHVLADDVDKIQIALGILHFPGFTACTFLTPSPYIDNVALKVYRRAGPEVYFNRADTPFMQANSAFPAGGTLDLGDPAGHSVRFDAVYGDSITVRVGVLRSGAVLTGPPEMHWRLQPNPLYDPYRSAVPANPVYGDSVGAPHLGDGRAGTNYAFDLPDTGFLFPGDVLHYYFRAEDDAGGDMGVATLPADTTGFSVFPGMPGYVIDRFPQDQEMRALPALRDFVTGGHPPILFWLDNVGSVELQYWKIMLANLGYVETVDYDFFKQPWNSPLEATAEQLAGYEVLLYSSGKSIYTSLEAEETIAIEQWLELGGKKVLFCGDDIVSKMSPNHWAFITDTMGIDRWPPVALDNVRPSIDDQAAPLVLPVAGNPLGLTTVFHADGTCYYNLFDALVPEGSSVAILEYADPNGAPGGYIPAAGVYNYLTDWDSHVVTLPYGLAFAKTPLDYEYGPIAARTRLLGEILAFFGVPGSGPATSVPFPANVAVRCYPNPFNPTITLDYSLPQAGHLKVKVFNLRGELVRVLFDETAPAGPGTLQWDGRDAGNSPAPSGVYFFELKALDTVEIRKSALIK